jgi:hypothetical protein
MQKFFLLLSFFVAALNMQANSVQVINSTTAGTLTSKMDADVNDLTVTGKINQIDFETMKNASLLGDLEKVDISGVVIEAVDVQNGVDDEGTPIINHHGSDTIPFRAFYDCNYLRSIKLPTTAVLIESYAFGGCARLTAIDIPVTITDFGVGVFESSGLKSFKFPANIRYVGPYFFLNCIDLESVDFSAATNFDGLLDKTFQSCSSLKTIDLSPTKITRTEATFVLCTALESVKFPTTLEEIGTQTFQCTKSLKSYTIPSHVKRMGSLVFTESGLESIKIPATLEYIGASFLTQSENLKSVNFSACANLETVPDQRGKGILTLDGTVKDCISLETVDFSACTKIKETWFLFTNCPKLKTIILPSSIEYIGAYTFADCTSLSKIYVQSLTPPQFDFAEENIFGNVPANCTLYVPFGTLAAYQNTPLWKDFYIEEGTPPMTGMDAITTTTTIVSQEFYSLTGSYMGKSSGNLSRGLYIVKNTYDNGAIRSEKVLVNK